MASDSRSAPCPNDDDGLLVSPGTPLYRALSRLERRNKIVVVCGIPGTGKSMVIGQLARMAHRMERPVHLLQWDVARLAFELPWALELFPEVDGVTHPIIRRACGLWARNAVYEWRRRHDGDDCLLIVEAPLVGGRFIDFALPSKGVIGRTLTAPDTDFAVAVPSVRVRREIERARRRTSAAPGHAAERADAAPGVMSGLWEEVLGVASELGIARGRSPRYAPQVYWRVFRHVLRHRRVHALKLDELLTTGGRSVHELGFWAKHMRPESSVADDLLQEVHGRIPDHDWLAGQMAQWYLT